MNTLTRGEQKSLALHRFVAARISTDASLVVVAKARLRWLRDKNPSGAPYYDLWEALLDGPVDMMIDVMLSPSERSCALRQENPFVDLVDQKERARIYRETIASLDMIKPS